MDTLIENPWLALVTSGFFALLWWATRSKMTGYVALLWACYSGYEWLMQVRVLCTGECNIRIDLLLIYPILLVLSIVAVVNSVRARMRTRRAA